MNETVEIEIEGIRETNSKRIRRNRNRKNK